MESEQLHYISFANQEVAISSAFPEVIAPFLLAFEALLVDEPQDVIAELAVVKDGEGYRVEGGRMFEENRETARGVLQHLKFELIHRFVDVHPELIWLHAGAAAKDDNAIMLCGAWGSGKSTMVGNLCKKGWTYLSDDIVPIEMEARRLMSFPLTPMMRAHDQSDSKVRLSPLEISNLKKQVVELEESDFAQGTRELAAIIFPQYDPEAKGTSLKPIAPATATMELLRNCLDLKFHKEEAVQYLGGLVEKLPVYLLRYNNGEKAADLLIDTHQNGYGKSIKASAGSA